MKNVKSVKYDLESWCKENNKENILAEWDYASNKGLVNGFGVDISTPERVAYSSNITVGWICDQGHHYRAIIGNRTQNGRGCPYCSGNKLLQGYNDFETWCKNNNRQDLLEEWNYEKNNGLKPCDIIYGGAKKKYWWKGACGHEWDSVISSRTRERQGKTKIVKSAGCPYCSNPPKRVLKGFNDLETWCKDNHRISLLKEWDSERNDIMPTEVTYGSGKYVWWKCNKNHEWRTKICCRTEGSRTNCPVCARTQTSFPEQAIAYYLMKEYDVLQRYRISGREVDIFLPEYKIAVEYDGSRWHMGEEKVNKDLEKSKKITGNSVRLIRIRETNDTNRIGTSAGLQTIEFIANNGKYITTDFEWAIGELFKLINDISGQTRIPSIDMTRDEFLVRAHYMNVLKANSVAAVFPELVKEWDTEKNEGVTPDAFSSKNNKKVWWKCEYGHSWLATINSRGVHKLGCPYCAGQKVISGYNDFESWCKENNPDLLCEWDYEKNIARPNEIPKTYKAKMFWRCREGHKWEATVYNRFNGTGCPICNTGNNVKRNKVSLEEWCIKNNPQLLQEWNYAKNGNMTPKTISYGSHAKVWWKCLKDHEWQAQIKSRTYKHGCPYCSGTNKKAIKGLNDLESWCKSNHKEYILTEWDASKNGELYPDMVTWGSHKRIHWKCVKGHEWEAVIKERTKLHGNMCPVCRMGK